MNPSEFIDYSVSDVRRVKVSGRTHWVGRLTVAGKSFGVTRINGSWQQEIPGVGLYDLLPDVAAALQGYVTTIERKERLASAKLERDMTTDE